MPNNTPLLQCEPNPSDHCIQEEIPAPSAMTNDINGFMECFKSQHSTLISVSVVLLYPFYTMMQMPVIKACRAFRIVGGAVCMLDIICLCLSIGLRLRAWAVVREGKAEQFMKDIFNVRNGPSRREAAIVLNAPYFLMSATMFLFAIELVGYVWLSIPCDPAELEVPPLDIAESVLLQVAASVGAAFCGRSFRTIRQLGNATELVPEAADPVTAAQEKV
ncbi:uncharacterized protein PHACADRAFT_252566 [Phanerochaete carnosa HHB-10118-sp]|uniref:Uncharacterized protein n=1 Tax=Phanerochaete carnosa (strain HHB-10118-sp) TaxID=650164 RepID=K5WGB8_PHACS|nr:uncharacterized protein PHACADRAFT_252566 [Phanerochaete carnosa HHB-10118-sp]EKM58330.1 hypothetical protein PHACADRAFT_252566 [Phanerochaete carnosa HHB-10118-sp]